MISIVDYGASNLKNVYRAFITLGFDAVVTSDRKVIDSSRAVVIPGVGAFRDAVNNLNRLGLLECIRENAASNKMMLGICLGMQLFYDKSYEDGEYEGLKILKGEIIRFDGSLKVPHMGWNNLIINRDDDIIRGIHENEYVYFVHSYYLKPENPNEVILSSDYGVSVPAVVRKDNIIGIQFHPEKSGSTGMKLLKNFGRMIG